MTDCEMSSNKGGMNSHGVYAFKSKLFIRGGIAHGGEIIDDTGKKVVLDAGFVFAVTGCGIEITDLATIESYDSRIGVILVQSLSTLFIQDALFS